MFLRSSFVIASLVAPAILESFSKKRWYESLISAAFNITGSIFVWSTLTIETC